MLGMPLVAHRREGGRQYLNCWHRRIQVGPLAVVSNVADPIDLPANLVCPGTDAIIGHPAVQCYAPEPVRTIIRMRAAHAINPDPWQAV